METLADTLWTEFAVETEEHLQAVEPILAQAETSTADIAQLFRSFHSIKGLARAMDMLGMEGVAHHAENLLGLVRDGRTPLSDDLGDLLLQSVDALRRMRDAVTEMRIDTPPDPQLLARLATAFASAGGEIEATTPVTAQVPVLAASDTPLHDDPEMVAIFVEMIKARGPELCAALADTATERGAALDAAETLTHAAEVMALDAVAGSFAGLHERLEELGATSALDDATRQDLMSRLGDIKLQIELVGEITGQDSGATAFSAELARHAGGACGALIDQLGDINRRLQENLADGERPAAEADAAAIVAGARALYATLAAAGLTRMAEIILLVEDIYARIAGAEFDAAEPFVEVGDDIFTALADSISVADDLAEDAAAEFAARLRAPSTAERLVQGEGVGRLVAGVYIRSEMLTFLSDEQLEIVERGLKQEGLQLYEILLHLEAEPETAERLIGWLSAETRPITNRTVVTEGESWFEFLTLSALDPGAVTASIHATDPEQHCVKRVRRLTETPGGEVVIDPSGTASPAAPAAEVTAAARPGAAGNLIRVRGEIVDAFLDDIGELRVMTESLTHVIRGVGSRAILAKARAFVEKLPHDLRTEFQASFSDFRERDRRLLETEEQISALLSRLHQSALELRVVPVDVVFNRLPRLVRDLAQRQGKSVELVLEGRDVRIDKSMVEALADPLIHMVRNAVDHGLETLEERRRTEKPERARLILRASQRGSEIHIEVADDGRGLDAGAIRARAVGRGLITAAQASALPDSEIHHFIFEAGLSTAAMVTETSGRGVGMDIVLSGVRRLNGDITIRSERGRGTVFTLILPVSAALQTALIVRVADQSLAIPERHVMGVTEVERQSIQLIGAHRSILHRQAVLPLYELGGLLGMRDGTMPPERPYEPVVVTTNGRQMIGLEVDAIEQRQELFLKDLDPRLASFPGVGGASVLGDGRVVLVLDGEELIQLAARGIDRGVTAGERLAS